MLGIRRPRSVPTCTQHWSSRSSSMVFMSMNGLIVIRLMRWHTRLPKRFVLPTNASPARRTSVDRPRSQLSHTSRKSCATDGCVSELCSLNRPSNASLTRRRSCALNSGSLIRFATRSRCVLSRSCPMIPTSDFHVTFVRAKHVADATAVRMRTRKRGEIAPGHEPVRLRPKPRQNAGMRPN